MCQRCASDWRGFSTVLNFAIWAQGRVMAMVGLCQKTGWRVGVVRTTLEAVVCLIGCSLGRYRGIRDSAICRRRWLGRPNYATVYHRALRVSLGVN